MWLLILSDILSISFTSTYIEGRTWLNSNTSWDIRICHHIVFPINFNVKIVQMCLKKVGIVNRDSTLQSNKMIRINWIVSHQTENKMISIRKQTNCIYAPMHPSHSIEDHWGATETSLTALHNFNPIHLNIQCLSTVNPLLSRPGGLFFPGTFGGGWGGGA